LTMVLYQPIREKSRLLFRHFKNAGHFFADGTIILPAVGFQALGAILDAIFRVCKAAAALVAQGVKGTIAEQAAEGFRVSAWMAGEIFAFLVLEKIIVGHFYSS
jgi:hypothetical protein